MSGIEEFWKLHHARLQPYTPDGYEPNRLLRGGIGRVCTNADVYLNELYGRGLDVYFSKIESEGWKCDAPVNVLVVHFITKVYTAVGLHGYSEPLLTFSEDSQPGIVSSRVLHVVPKGTM